MSGIQCHNTQLKDTSIVRGSSTTGHWESMVHGLGSTGQCRNTRNWDARQISANCRSAVAWQQTSHFSVSSLPLSLYRSHSQTTSVLPLLLKVLIRDYGFWRGSQQKWTEGRIQVCVISTSTMPLFFSDSLTIILFSAGSTDLTRNQITKLQNWLNWPCRLLIWKLWKTSCSKPLNCIRHLLDLQIGKWQHNTTSYYSL